ncbi:MULTISPECIES: histidine phosphatase family protein [Halomonas]|uniref:Glucosyl-3-phosphoglycerate phosphatase n=1 Tax=Halomonas chromatireducens TaxID=507626 RepID=A0A125R0R9_9GAMM|nr:MULTISPECIES: histidine phosphatase family protein [Halomonas]AMD02586.1 Glucosyl-3-phosphoglycerate phosphatase [Halomonas chromatireducens]MBZ0332479.1 histidine phosphatase family protein [Halomonas sp. ANAO-440]
MSNGFLNASTQRRNRYLLMRHGHSQANAQGLIISTPERGLEAFGLSSQGIAQLDALLLDWRWPTPTRILHSDFLRTTETAARVATHFALPLQREPRLRERNFGDFEGQADDQYPCVWALDTRSAEHVEHGVESVVSVAERMQAVIEELEHSTAGETVLLVSHGDPLQILLTALKGRPLSQHRDQEPLAPASLTVLS